MIHADRVVRLLVASFAIDCVLAGALRLDSLAKLLHGETGWRSILGSLALVWMALLLLVLARVLRHVGGLRSAVTDRDDRLAAVQATSHDWLWEATDELVVISCSQGVSDILGYVPEQMVGRCFTEFQTPASAERTRQLLAECLHHGTGWNDIELDWVHADGSVLSLQGSGVPVRDAAGRVVGFCGTRRPTPHGAAAERRLAAIRHRVEDVLHAGSLRVALQPVVSLDDGRLRSAEALARFADQRSPAVWFAEAHEVGLGLELELLAVAAALEAASELPAEVSVSLNASPALVADPRFADAILNQTLPAERVVVEITEHAAIEGYAELAAALLPLRERGLQLAVDDTGAGYASFSHVLRLRPDAIKLDRSLLANIAEDAAARALVTAVVLLALEMNATVVAEGVETASELRAVATLGIDCAQGYLLARPTTDRRQWSRWWGRRWETVNAPSAARRTGAAVAT